MLVRLAGRNRRRNYRSLLLSLARRDRRITNNSVRSSFPLRAHVEPSYLTPGKVRIITMLRLLLAAASLLILHEALSIASAQAQSTMTLSPTEPLQSAPHGEGNVYAAETLR